MMLVDADDLDVIDNYLYITIYETNLCEHCMYFVHTIYNTNDYIDAPILGITRQDCIDFINVLPDRDSMLLNTKHNKFGSILSIIMLKKIEYYYIITDTKEKFKGIDETVRDWFD